jgi:hypothetical protein
MTLQARRKSRAANAFEVLAAGVDSSTDALATLKQYIKHLEELLLVELGRDEFTCRLETIRRRDEESLFIPEYNSGSRKRDSTSTESGSSPKKARSDSSASSLSVVSGLGRSLFDKARSEQSDSSAPELSPKTTRKSPVSEPPMVERQQATVQQMALRSVYPIPQSRRGSQAAMLPNTQPSSNFHSGTSSPSASETSQGPPVVDRPQQKTRTLMRRDSVQSDEVPKNKRTGPVSSVLNAAIQRHACPKPASKFNAPSSRPATPTLSSKPACSTLQCSTSTSSVGALTLVKRPSTPSSKSSPSVPSQPSSVPNKRPSFVSIELSSSVSIKPTSVSTKLSSSVSSKPSSVQSKPTSLSTKLPSSLPSKLSFLSAVASNEPSSSKRKPWRAAKKG